MQQLIRMTGRNGVVYEERMTQEQITQFLHFAGANMSLGVAFEEWEITVEEVVEQVLDEYERADAPVDCSTSAVACPAYLPGRRPKGII
jgi:hypothetical protein